MQRFILGFIIIILIIAIIIGNCDDDSGYYEDRDTFVENEVEEEIKPVDFTSKTKVNEFLHAIYYDTTSLEIPISVKSVPEQILDRYAYITTC